MSMVEADPPQVPLDDVPDQSLGTPDCYLSIEAAQTVLSTRWNLKAPTLALGHLLAATMELDQEGPFQGVKMFPAQERDWPRTFKYGWPNMIATPSPVMVDTQYPGVWYLNYEEVVPQQIVDWVCLQAWRHLNLPFDRSITQETVGAGVGVHYAPPLGVKGGQASELDTIQDALIIPFLVRSGHTSPFSNFTNL